MEHAEAHEQLADLALDPRALLALDREASPAIVELRAHIEGCPTCSAEVRAWRETHAAVLEALTASTDQGGAASSDDQPIALPPGLRASVARAVAAEVAAVGGAERRSSGPDVVGSGDRAPRTRFDLILGGRRPWLALAAALVLAVAGSSAIALDQSHRGEVARADSASLAVLVARTEGILADPAHTSVTLAAADGSSAGLIAWTETDAVVLTTHLAAPAEGLVYRCWVEQGTTRTPVGEMSFRQGVGYWWQHPNEAGGASLWNGGRLIVTLGPAGGPGGPAILSAPLPG